MCPDLYLMSLWYHFESFEGTRKSSAGNVGFELLAGPSHASLTGFLVGPLFAGGTSISSVGNATVRDIR